MRYTSAKQFIDKETNKRKLETVSYPEIPLKIGDLYIQANKGTRLDIISQEYYGTAKYWWVIALANKMGKGTLYVTPGSQLRIPVDPQLYTNRIG